MDATSDVARDPQDGTSSAQRREIDWDAYATQYDILATANPSYRENIEILRSLIPDFDLPRDPVICDIGAGTGNFICAIAQDLPSAKFVHLDADETMNQLAREKYQSAQLSNVEIKHCLASDANFAAGTFDLIICVNALYAIRPRDEFLMKARRWLKPNGIFFIIDFGRRFDALSWSLYIIGSVIKQGGLREAVRVVKNGLETLRQNRRGSDGQADGLYWLHSTEEFADELTRAGYTVDQLRTCYRGYCDLAVCRSTQN